MVLIAMVLMGAPGRGPGEFLLLLPAPLLTPYLDGARLTPSPSDHPQGTVSRASAGSSSAACISFL